MEKLAGINSFKLTDRVAIITGGSKGLGFAMAEGLASAGARVALVNRNQKEGEEAATRIANEYGTDCLAISADVRDEKAMAEMARQVQGTWGQIDILINNAGINVRGAIDVLAQSEFQNVMDVNVLGTWLPTRAVVPMMKAQGSGKVINIASALGLVGLEDRTPYASSKGAVVQMTRALSLELAPHNIQVNAICPGPFLTEMNIPIAESEQAKKFIVGATALGRWGKLEEIQGVAILLASPASDYMVGSIISVDGGWTAR